MMIHVESAVSKKKPATTSYQAAMIFYLQNISKAMIASLNNVLLLLEHEFIDEYIPWYHHEPAQVVQNNSTKILWNFQIQTDHEVINKKPDVIVVDKINKTANLIEIAVPNDYNICNKRLQKMRACTTLSGEIKTLWNLNKVQITSIIVGAMGTFHNKFDDDISKLRLTNHKFRAEEAEKTAC